MTRQFIISTMRRLVSFGYIQKYVLANSAFKLAPRTVKTRNHFLDLPKINLFYNTRSLHHKSILLDSLKQKADHEAIEENQFEVDKTEKNEENSKVKRKIPKANKMPPRPQLPESEISEKFIKGGSGKGGQKINKTNSKVQLTHIPTGLVVTSQATRSRDQNRKIARQILAMKIQEMELGENSRARIVVERKRMLKQRSKKKSKAKYRKLEESKLLEKERLANQNESVHENHEAKEWEDVNNS